MNKRALFVVVIIFLFTVMNANISCAEAGLGKSSSVLFNRNTLYVGGDGPGNFSKIQYAINNASDGDTIFVYSGIYYERIIVNKSVDLIGEDRESTVIDGGGTYYVVYIGDNNVSVRNFYINNSGIYGTYSGIKIHGEFKNITIENNIIMDNYFGICIGDPYYYKRIYNVNIINNYIQNNEFGIGFYEGYETFIENNEFINNGIFIVRSSSRDNIVKNNTINGLPIVYLEKQSDKIIQPNVGQIILMDCKNITVFSQLLDIKCEIGIELIRCNNCNVIKNHISNKYFGILSYYSDNNNIQVNLIENVTRGISMDKSDKNIISLNRFNDSSDSIEIDESNENEISYNYLTNGSTGIDLWHANKNIFSKNNINHFYDYGISLDFACSRNQILNNSIKNCLDAGILISGSGRIWWDMACVLNVVSGNEIKNNDLGIILDDSALTKVFYNTIMQNNIGVELRSAKYNRIFKNNIFENKDEDAILKNSFYSRFNRNFWNETKRVHVIKGGIYRWDFWGNIFYEVLPIPRFDWNPVKEPYKI